MKWIIDRFEGDYAVAECGNTYFNIPKTVLPADVSEGDVLDVEINTSETESREKQLKGRLKKLFGE